ncbi:unnamed protein product, partial [Mesorhabditis belari]|uniref:Cyclin N-terminal domain-containing protein n=1 Tax=Mesorhabditis belari TaxID=2138241 RepID=A0AAF3FAZ4_9BILA
MNCDLVPIFAYSKKWVFKENYQPTTVYQGMPVNIELTHRRQAIDYIYKLQEILSKYGQLIPNVNVLISAVYLQRFYYVHSFYSVDAKQLAAASLFLACKTNDPCVPIGKLARAYWELNFPNTPGLPTSKLDDVTQIIVELEKALLLTLGFDIHVDLPHPVVLKMFMELSWTNVKDLKRLSYQFATDVICQTDLILRYTKEEIAVACIFSISSWMNFKIPVNEWWKQFVPMLEEDVLIVFSTHNDKRALFNQTHSLLGGCYVSSEVIADDEKTSESNSDTDDLTSSAQAPPLSPSDGGFVSASSDDDDGIVVKKPRL